MKLRKVILCIIFILMSCCIIGCKSESKNDTKNELINNNEISAVTKNGIIGSEGNVIVNKDGEVITLPGMSLFWSQWGGKYYNASCIKWLKD